MRTEQQKVLLASSVSEKTFILTDELRVKSAAQPIGEVLKTKTMLKCDEIKPVGNKAVIKGTAISEIVYSAKDTSDICVENFTTPFSQIVETDQSNEAATITAQMMLTGVYITRNLLDDGSGEAMTLEIHAVAQCTAYTEFDIEYVADVYSPKYELSLGQGEYSLDSFGDISTSSDTVKGLIPAEKPDVVRALSINPGHIVCTPKDNITSVAMDFSVSIIYTDVSGNLCCASKKLEYVHDYEMKLDSSDIEIVCGDEFTSTVENGIELRIPIEVNIRRRDNIGICCVETIEYDETAPKDAASLPSMTIIRVGDKCDLWSIAKRYDSSIAVITEVNELNDDKPIKANEILMIPRLR
jgi:hypothetical protein